MDVLRSRRVAGLAHGPLAAPLRGLAGVGAIVFVALGAACASEQAKPSPVLEYRMPADHVAGLGNMVPPDAFAGGGKPMGTFSEALELAGGALTLPSPSAQGEGSEREGVQAQAEAEMLPLSHEAVMEEAGVPVEWRADLDVIVECESRWNPGAVGDHGNSLGAGQINWATWFPYALDLGLVEEADRPHWDDPVINLKVAVGVVRYDIARGYPMWAQWSCATLNGIP